MFFQTASGKNGFKKKRIWLETNRYNFPTKLIWALLKSPFCSEKETTFCLSAASYHQKPNLLRWHSAAHAKNPGLLKVSGRRNGLEIVTWWQIYGNCWIILVVQKSSNQHCKNVKTNCKKWEKRSNELFSRISSIKHMNRFLNLLLLEFNINNLTITFHAVPSTVLRSAQKHRKRATWHVMMSKFHNLQMDLIHFLNVLKSAHKRILEWIGSPTLKVY